MQRTTRWLLPRLRDRLVSVRRSGRVVVVGISGPDGAGKSTLARTLAADQAAAGAPIAEAYLYGCFICRRSSKPLRPPTRAGSLVVRRRGIVDAVAELALRAHALLDALELSLALTRAERQAAQRARGDATGKAADLVDDLPLVVTDRSPLDGLVKHQPGIGSSIAQAFLRSADRYSLIVLLDAPAAILAARDAEHSVAELELTRRRFLEWHQRLPNVARVDATAPDAVVAERVRALIKTHRTRVRTSCRFHSGLIPD
jgi:ATPase subunit of ABC transporter with duplicated ATPase domains